MSEAGPYALVATPLRTFVVENNDDTRDPLSLFLEPMGHSVRSAASLAEALERWPASASAVLISDLGLPVDAERLERVLDEARRERDARRSP